MSQSTPRSDQVSTSPDTTDALEQQYTNAAIIRDMLRHENELINQRMTWLATFQGLLFASLGFSWDKPDARGIVTVIGVTGILVALSALTAFRLSMMAVEKLNRWWREYTKRTFYQGPDVMGLDGRRTWLGKIMFLSPWHLLPWVFIVAWLTVLYFNMTRLSFPADSAFSTH